ncbi:MAG TPA: Calx-beta domain-containing protein [Candidatus Limnocylindria bacterium]|nr:Calx-beta domain-containing protein [Candidatus Limnocylindria bacterium]
MLRRDRAADFPVVEQLDFDVALGAVRGDPTHLYVAGRDGVLYIYRKTSPLTLVASLTIADLQLVGLDVVDNRIYVAVGQAHVAADAGHVYASSLAASDAVVEIVKGTWTRGVSYDGFEPDVTVVFDRLTGARLSAIPNPADSTGDRGISAVYADREIVGQMRPGCCGLGVSLFDPATIAFDQRLASRNSNSLARRGRWLLVGTEAGTVEVWDIGRRPAPVVARVDLRALTGHTGIEDIEVRALWFDEVDNLLFAGSSWGNDQSRSPALPAFFVLQLDTGEPTLRLANTRVTEGDAGTTPAVFTATLSAPSADTVTVDVETSNGTAKAADFVATTGRLTFPPGTVRQTFTVAVKGDTAVEADETFFATLSNPINATLKRARAKAIIVNDDAAAAAVAATTVSIAATRATATEGGTNGIFTVTRTGSTDASLKVRYTVAGTATPTVDYRARSGTVTIPGGAASARIVVVAAADDIADGGETVVVTLAAGTGYEVGSPAAATVRIADGP